MSLNTASTKPGATFINTSERVAYQTPLLTPTRFGSSTAVEKPAPNPILFKDCGAVPLHCHPGCGVLWSGLETRTTPVPARHGAEASGRWRPSAHLRSACKVSVAWEHRTSRTLRSQKLRLFARCADQQPEAQAVKP